MSGPTLSDLRSLAGDRVRVVVPKPREDQRLEGVVSVDTDADGSAVVRLRIDGGVGGDRFRTVRFRERDGDGVLQAVRGDGALVGRVRSVEAVDDA